MRFVNIGFGSIIAVQRIIAVVSPESAPIKRVVQIAKNDNSLIDATFGRKTKSVIITDSGQTFISSVTAQELLDKINANE